MSWREAEANYDDPVIGDSPIPELFENAAERHTDATYQRYKGGIHERSVTPDPVTPAPDGAFGTLTYAEVRRIVRHLAAGFRALGVTHGDRVAVLSRTRMEWAQADLAVLAAGGVVTTIYDDASTSTITHILEDADVEGVVVEDAARESRVREAVADPGFLVQIDASVDEGTDAITLGELHRRGRKAFEQSAYGDWLDAMGPEDLASIVYTSGTTGRPKGVRLTHGNLRANINQIRKRYGPRPDKPAALPTLDADTVSVSFLPLAHIFERTVGHFSLLAAGATVAYAESPDTLQTDFQAIHPNMATSVPRVYEKIYAAIREEAEGSAVRERIFEWAVDVGRRYHRAEDPGVVLSVAHTIADRLVFRRVKAALGGELEMLVSGGGSLSPHLAELFDGMGLPIYEGYGLTETSPVLTGNPVEAPKIGTIGPPVVDLETRTVPVAGWEDEAVGELHVRGPNVAPGYWELPDETERAFDADGWFHTGDIVRERADGYFEFVERAKEVMVLSTGKNVAPGPIEDAFAASEVIEQCMLVGNDRKFVGALIVPNEAAVRARLDGDLPPDLDALFARPEARAVMEAEVEAVNAHLDPHKTIKRFELVAEEFTAENDLMTPTLKKKRGHIRDRYAEKVEAIYADA